MALSICAARSTKGREAGARRGAGAEAWTTPASAGPGSRVCPRGPVYSPPARACTDRLGGAGVRRWMGDRSLALVWAAATDLWSASVRAFIGEMGFGAGFLRSWCGACVLRMLARPRGAPVRARAADASGNGRTPISAAPHLLLAHSASNVST